MRHVSAYLHVPGRQLQFNVYRIWTGYRRGCIRRGWRSPERQRVAGGHYSSACNTRCVRRVLVDSSAVGGCTSWVWQSIAIAMPAESILRSFFLSLFFFKLWNLIPSRRFLFRASHPFSQCTNVHANFCCIFIILHSNAAEENIIGAICRYKYLRNPTKTGRRYDWLSSCVSVQPSSRMATLSPFYKTLTAAMQLNAVQLDRFRRCIWTNKAAERKRLLRPFRIKKKMDIS